MQLAPPKTQNLEQNVSITILFLVIQLFCRSWIEVLSDNTTKGAFNNTVNNNGETLEKLNEADERMKGSVGYFCSFF